VRGKLTMKKRKECNHYNIVYCFHNLDPNVKWNYGIAPRCTAKEDEAEACPLFEEKPITVESNEKKD
jgi:hypothetical protein